MNFKKQNQKIHAKKRALERFDLNLTNDDLIHIGAKIKKGESIYIRKMSNRVKLHQVEYNGQILKVVYDKLRHQVVSFLTEDMK